MDSDFNANSNNSLHQRWVKITHWCITVGFLILVFSGIEILMVHPRLYWGEAGNELTPALFELPISRNYHRKDWGKRISFFSKENSPVSVSRTSDDLMFNQNGWGRSLHFLAAWLLTVTGIIYFLNGIFSGHLKNNIWPKVRELSPRIFWRDMINHLRMQIPLATGGPQYGILQKLSYVIVIFIALPLAFITGLTMSPAITATFPFLLDVFGGYQSARTIHFFTSITLELFLLVHLLMIIKSGFVQQIRYMTTGK